MDGVILTYFLCLEATLPSSPPPSSLLLVPPYSPLLASSPSSLFPLSPSSLSPLLLFSLTGMCWFKPSVQKKDDALRFVPCNLHIQRMRAQSNGKGTRVLDITRHWYYISSFPSPFLPNSSSQPHPSSQPPPFKLGDVWEWAPSIRTAWE